MIKTTGGWVGRGDLGHAQGKDQRDETADRQTNWDQGAAYAADALPERVDATQKEYR